MDNNAATSLYPFAPAGKDFERAIAYFGELGFQPQWCNSDVAGMRFGGAYFLLQNIDSPQWAEMQMITYEVPDLEAYWETLSAKNLPEKFPGSRINPPKDFPWGREVHVVDLAGVLWHVRQTRK